MNRVGWDQNQKNFHNHDNKGLTIKEKTKKDFFLCKHFSKSHDMTSFCNIYEEILISMRPLSVVEQACRRLRQEDCHTFKASVVYPENSRLASYMDETLFQKK